MTEDPAVIGRFAKLGLRIVKASPEAWVEPLPKGWAGKRLRHEALIDRIEMLNLGAADLVVVVSRAMKEEGRGR